MTGGGLPGAEAPGDSVVPAVGLVGTMAGGMPGALAVGAEAATAIPKLVAEPLVSPAFPGASG